MYHLADQSVPAPRRATTRLPILAAPLRKPPIFLPMESFSCPLMHDPSQRLKGDRLNGTISGAMFPNRTYTVPLEA